MKGQIRPANRPIKARWNTGSLSGYTCIFNFQWMNLVSHEPFESKERAICEDLDILPTSVFIERKEARMLVGDTDIGTGLKTDIASLKCLLQAYRDGSVKESGEG